MVVETLLDDIFRVERVDPDGKKFDRGQLLQIECGPQFAMSGQDKDDYTFVSRIEANSEQYHYYMQLDVNNEIYPLRVGEKFKMVLTPTLNLDGTPDTGYYTQGGRKSFADDFEYVMHGKLYKISDSSGPNPKVEMCASFGGLLMLLKGDPTESQKFELDQKMFLLIRKV